MPRRPHINELFTAKNALQVVLLPAIFGVFFLIVPLPEETGLVVLIGYGIYMYGLVKEKMVTSDYGIKNNGSTPDNESHGEDRDAQ
ncbi:hypothetical protein IB238_05050 [Rhizobium sp. ARZ01]|uniref:hypothetical protein n=1 Tax=Rhizobium sp. ARZ01 TaxID=2769313 RepID=UPI0017816433|nr:hypothetical protein [Rhizobium sp. ARZ01]MBD9372004.1 hypothetical protein [Rhizobium sp. ARZ01]